MKCFFDKMKEPLEMLEANLAEVLHSQDNPDFETALAQLVKFFNITSVWYDIIMDDALDLYTRLQLDPMEAKKFSAFNVVLNNLRCHLKYTSGRITEWGNGAEWGFNHTEIGETVTREDIWLGGIATLKQNKAILLAKRGGKEAEEILKQQACNYYNQESKVLIQQIQNILVFDKKTA